MKKTTTLKLIALAALLSCGGKAWASDFDLSGLSAADIRASQTGVKPPAPQLEADEMIGVDMNVRIPFKMLKKEMAGMAASETRLTIIDEAAPVVSKSGEFLKVSNITVDAGGIIVVPTITLKPYLEGRDKLAIRVQKVQLHASMEPSVKSAAPAPAISQEQIMQQVMDVMIKAVYSSLNARLQAKKVPLTAEQIISLKYDKTAWTLHASLSSRILREFIPAGLMGDLHLTGFTFNDAGLVLKIETAE